LFHFLDNRSLVTWKAKESIWEEALRTTQVSLTRDVTEIVLKINMFSSYELFEKKLTDFSGSLTVFGQVFRQVFDLVPPSTFRLAVGKRAFKVESVGLSAQDVGGRVLSLVHHVLLSSVHFGVLPLLCLSLLCVCRLLQVPIAKSSNECALS
jgi:hypothetical protein